MYYNLGMIIFGLVRFLSKNSNQTDFFKKNQNQFKPTGFGSVWFFMTKTGSNRFCLVFSGFFFSLGSIRFF